MGLIKLAANFKQLIRPLQRNKYMMGAGIGVGAGFGALIGSGTNIETDAYGGIKRDRSGKIKRKPGTSTLKRALTGAAIGGTFAGGIGSAMAVDIDRYGLDGAKRIRNIKNATRRIKADNEEWTKRFKRESEEWTKDFDNKFGEDFFKDFGSDDWFKKQTGSSFGRSGFGGSFGRNSYGRSSYTPPPPPRPRQSDYASSDNIKNFFKNHHNIDHTTIKTKVEAKKAYRRGAAMYHPDTTPHPHMKDGNKFKEYQSNWEQIEKSPWFEKLANMRSTLREIMWIN